MSFNYFKPSKIFLVLELNILVMRYFIYTLSLGFALSFNSCAKRVVVEQPTTVTVVKQLPRSYKVVRIKGKRYYFFNGKRYKKTKRGYVIVRV